MKHTIEDFGRGQKVNVEPMDGDLFDSFTGTVVGFNGMFVWVKDQDGDTWECEPEQLTYCSDDYMH